MTARFPVPREDPFAPPARYRVAGDPAPRRVTLAYGGAAWLVTAHDDARAILADTRFSSDPTQPAYPNFPLASKRPVPGHFLAMDPPEHTRLRRTVAGDFTAAALRPLRPRIAGHTATLVAAMAADRAPGDVVGRLAVPLPALTAAEILGVPVADRSVFAAAAADLQTHDVSPATRAFGAGRMNRYLAGLIEAKRRDGGGADLLSRLVAEDELTGPELVGVANLILLAGLETTTGLLGLTVLALLCDPAQARMVQADPDRWAEPAIREALRYWTVVHHGLARVATADVAVSGRLIRAGDAVVVHLPSANRDPAVYPAPDRFDITRDARGHLAFGYGPHRCLGGGLAELQAAVAVAELFRRLPGLRLVAAPEPAAFLGDMLVYGVRELAVTWDEAVPHADERREEGGG